MDERDSHSTRAPAATLGWLAGMLGWLGRSEVAAGAWTAVALLVAASVLRPELAAATRLAAVLAAICALLAILAGQLDRLGGARVVLPFFSEELSPAQRGRVVALRRSTRRAAWAHRFALAWVYVGLAGAIVWWKSPGPPQGALHMLPGQVVTSVTHTTVAGDRWRQLLDAELRVTRITRDGGVLVVALEAVRPGTEQAASFSLRAGERARVQRDRLTLAGAFSSSAVRGATVRATGPDGALYEGVLRIGEVVAVGSHTIEMLDGALERSGWIGGGVLVRERDGAGAVVREGWVPVDRAGWDARHGGGSIGVDVLALAPGEGVVLNVERVVSPVVAGTTASIWAAVLALLVGWLLRGRVWVAGRDGDHEVAGASLVAGRANAAVESTVTGLLAAEQYAELVALRAELSSQTPTEARP